MSVTPTVPTTDSEYLVYHDGDVKPCNIPPMSGVRIRKSPHPVEGARDPLVVVLGSASWLAGERQTGATAGEPYVPCLKPIPGSRAHYIERDDLAEFLAYVTRHNILTTVEAELSQ